MKSIPNEQKRLELIKEFALMGQVFIQSSKVGKAFLCFLSICNIASNSYNYNFSNYETLKKSYKKLKKS